MKPEYFLLPDVAEMWVQGKVTGTGASIAASVNGADAIPMNRRGDIFGYLVPLEPGTNVVVVTSADAAGQNPSSKVLVVERTDLYQVQLQQWWYGNASTLGKGEFNNGSPRYVEGTVNAQIEYGGATLGLAAVSVNGSAAWFEDWGGGQGYFAMTNSVNGGTNCTVMPLVLALCYTNGNYSAVLCPKVPLGLLEGYEIASKTVHYRKDAPTLVGSSVWWPPAFWIDYNATNGPCAGQWVIVRAKKQVEQESFSMPCTATETNSVLDDTTYAAATNCVAVPALTNITAWVVSSYWSPYYGTVYETTHTEQHLMQPLRSLRFGTLDAYSDQVRDEPADGVVDSISREIGWIKDEGELVVRWPFFYAAGQVVLLTFEGVEYTRVAGEEFVGTNVLYQGQAPVAVNGHDLSYLVTCPGGGTPLTLNAAAFDWPESEVATNYVEAEWGDRLWIRDGRTTAHHLTFTGFHNSRIQCNRFVEKGLLVCPVCEWGQTAPLHCDQVTGKVSYPTDWSVKVFGLVKGDNACNAVDLDCYDGKVSWPPVTITKYPDTGSTIVWLSGLIANTSYTVSVDVTASATGGNIGAGSVYFYRPDGTQLYFGTGYKKRPLSYTTNCVWTITADGNGHAHVIDYHPVLATSTNIGMSTASATISVKILPP